MKQLIAFTKKEFTEGYRTGKFLILIIVFVVFGIMNPAVAKLTPWMMNLLSDTLKEAGMTVANIEVNAMTSWEQFVKNLPMGMIVFMIMFGGIMTAEYQKGTLINILTKGLSRWKVVAAKSILTVSFWTLCYWMCFFITYIYNEYFWDNKIVSNLFLSAFCLYLFGIWLISLIIFASSFMNSNSSVLLFTGGTFFVVYLCSLVPSISEYLPTRLLSSNEMLQGAINGSDMIISILITMLITITAFAFSVVIFNKKQI